MLCRGVAWQGKCALARLARRAQLHCDIGDARPPYACFVGLQACGLDASDCCGCMRCVGSAVVASCQMAQLAQLALLAQLGSARQPHLFGHCQSEQHFSKWQRSFQACEKKSNTRAVWTCHWCLSPRVIRLSPPLLARIGASSVRLLLTSFHSNRSITAGATLLPQHGSTASITRR